MLSYKLQANKQILLNLEGNLEIDTDLLFTLSISSVLSFQ